MNIIHKTKPTKRTLDKALFNKRITVCNKAVSPDEVNNHWSSVTCASCISSSRKVVLRKRVTIVRDTYYKTHYEGFNCKRVSPYGRNETSDKLRVTCKYCLKKMGRVNYEC